ncbi:MAG: hypothetical protein AAF141_11335 [Pseudomonadota bacterium]
MSFYPNLQQTSSRLIKQFGQSLTVTRGSGPFDPATGTTNAAAAVTFTINAVVLPASQGTIEAFDNRLTEQYRDKSVRFLNVAADSQEPESGDQVALDGANWRVLGVTPLNPAGTALLYRMGLVKL